jgi:S-layer homology domain
MAPTRSSRLVPAFAASVLVVLLGASSVLFGVCGPFTDVAADAFCPFVLEIFYLGVTTGTTPTTYDPTSNVNRLQMAAFLSRSVDGVLRRGSRRAALDQFWTTQNSTVLGLTTVGSNPRFLKSDDVNIWVANNAGNSVSRVRAGDGKLLETWTGAVGANGILVAMGRVLATGFTSPGNLYRIDPSEAAGAVTTVASNLGIGPFGITFDGARVWTANVGPTGSVSIVTPGATTPWTVTTVTTGFSGPTGALYDGANVWVTDPLPGTLLKLDSAGAILLAVTVGFPENPVFDGTNIWVPNNGSSTVSVVRTSSGAVLQTLTGSGLANPFAAAFDGQRVLVTNANTGSIVSLWKAADLAALGSFATGSSTNPFGACSDGVNFWIALEGAGKLARF